MPRRKRIFKKNIKPDAKFGNLLIGKFVGYIMKEGKRTTSERIMYDSFDIIHERTKKGGLNTFEQAIKNVSPLVELKSRRVGGANYQVPVPVSGERRTTLAMRWINKAASSKKGKAMAEKLADEFIDASNKTGAAMKKRDDVHRMADANKAFAHFA
ncbi:MAG: 30S ribosomal protein S7 [Candidatus Moranbacteria bacterium]|nr:30S ribosomal protein S7 [Candidatus Moranbacteria bacterium]MDZ4384810.1 30S ribosomal protein S7 [Candidatus Moranbacteria bacterium]